MNHALFRALSASNPVARSIEAGVGAPLTARKPLTRPAPTWLTSASGVGLFPLTCMGRAEAMKAALTWAGVAAGLPWRYCTARPAMFGVAAEVPKK